MRRTQLYLDDDLWDALHARARLEKITISELTRKAIRDRYLQKQDQRMKATQEFVGTRKKRSEPAGAVDYVRSPSRRSSGATAQGMSIPVDSDILIEVSRDGDPKVVSKWIELSKSSDAVLYSPVSVAELWAEARPNEHRSLNISSGC
jgi:hypothetical protein